MRRFLARFAAFAALLVFVPPSFAAGKGPLVFAAASLKNALDDVAKAWQKDSGTQATISYAASSALAKQIAAGAPADIFISANVEWVDYLAKRKLVASGKRVNLLGNSLVLIAPLSSKVSVTMTKPLDLKPALGDGRIAMANTNAVPAGKYGKAALQFLGAWDEVKGRIAQAQNVRAALVLVARGEAPLGIVYRTDAAIEPQVRVVATFPESSHPRIVYPAAVMAQSKNPAAGSFYAFLSTPAAAAIFERYGFMVLNAAH
jgi:molybdate transport system substrate-binding protein